jgi:hypothetical protein
VVVAEQVQITSTAVVHLAAKEELVGQVEELQARAVKMRQHQIHPHILDNMDCLVAAVQEERNQRGELVLVEHLEERDRSALAVQVEVDKSQLLRVVQVEVITAAVVVE